jgi:hypothetical protein
MHWTNYLQSTKYGKKQVLNLLEVVEILCIACSANNLKKGSL